MHPTHITANLSVPDIEEAGDFYHGYLGLTAVTRFRTPDGQAAVQLVTRNATAPVDSVISIAVGDEVEEAYKEAKTRIASG